MCLGLFCKRTPPWSGWSTVLVGLVTSFSILLFVKTQEALNLASTKFVVHVQLWIESHCQINLPTLANLVGWVLGLAAPFKAKETAQAVLIVTAFGGSWFVWSGSFPQRFFYKYSSQEYRSNVDEFFGRLKKPIEDLTAEQVKENHKVVGAIGVLCIIFWVFVHILLAIPNKGVKRLGFLCSGGSIVTVGWLLRRTSQRHQAVKTTTKSD